MSRPPSPEKYASAFSPPSVNCLTFRRRLSCGNSTGDRLFEGLWPAEKTAAARLNRRAKGNRVLLLINLKGTRRRRAST
jgi:hypothetical protein